MTPSGFRTAGALRTLNGWGDAHGQPVFLSIQVRLRAASKSYVLFDSYGLNWPRLLLWVTIDKLDFSGGVAQW